VGSRPIGHLRPYLAIDYTPNSPDAEAPERQRQLTDYHAQFQTKCEDRPSQLQNKLSRLSQHDVRIGDVVVDRHRDFVEARLVPASKLAPESVRFFGAEETHIQNAILVAILVRAGRPTASRDEEREARRAPGVEVCAPDAPLASPERLMLVGSCARAEPTVIASATAVTHTRRLAIAPSKECFGFPLCCGAEE